MTAQTLRRCTAALLLLALAPAWPLMLHSQQAGIVADVRAAIAAKELDRAEALIGTYRSARGETSEMIAALSWLARGAYAAGQFDRAVQHSVDTNDLVVAALRTKRLADDASLQTALGAAIETEALVRNARGDRASAVYFLERELEKYRDSPIHKRLAKNINLLSMEGQPVPALDAREMLGPPMPGAAQLKGNVVLLFFWAHWCPDCKAEGPIIARLLDKYRSQGLRLIAPTQRFGYIIEGTSAPRDAEMRHIVAVRDQYYPFLRSEPVPVSDANHKRFGVSSTPTLALVDRQGIVRVYHPGLMKEDELESAIRKLLSAATN